MVRIASLTTFFVFIELLATETWDNFASGQPDFQILVEDTLRFWQLSLAVLLVRHIFFNLDFTQSACCFFFIELILNCFVYVKAIQGIMLYRSDESIFAFAQ